MTTENQSNHQEDGHDHDHEHEHHEGCCAPATPILRDPLKVGRNDPCLCGSGKKFKKCCLSNR